MRNLPLYKKSPSFCPEVSGTGAALVFATIALILYEAKRDKLHSLLTVMRLRFIAAVSRMWPATAPVSQWCLCNTIISYGPSK